MKELKSVTIFTKNPIINVWQDPKLNFHMEIF